MAIVGIYYSAKKLSAEPVSLSPLLFLSLQLKEETKSQIGRN